MPAQAAKSVVFKYGILRESISVADLSTLAQTGEPPASLRAFLKLARRDPAQLRQVLTKEIAVNPISLSQILNSFPGEVVLDLVSDVIRTPSGRASRESLRGALVSSALPDGSINLLEVLENYPTPEVYLEGDRLVEIYNNINRIVGHLPDLK